MLKKITIPAILQKKSAGEKISVLTAYDYPTAVIADRSGIEILLVGDSMGMTVLGHETTIPVTMEDVLHHTKAVVRGTKNALVVADMPFGSYETDKKEAVKNAIRLIKEGGAKAVKLEGGLEQTAAISSIIKAGIPVMGHIGLLPQSAPLNNGYRVEGKDEGAALSLSETAQGLQELGVFAIVLECVTAQAAALISENLDIPTIGIGSGRHCDGQVLVVHDMLGLNTGHVPKFVKKYADMSAVMQQAFEAYVADVATGRFPTDEQSYFMEESEAQKLD